jgi:hypothetical protein
MPSHSYRSFKNAVTQHHHESHARGTRLATAGTWREHPFVPGQRYTVLKDCSYLGHDALAGAIIEYVDAGYERYDGTSLFRFVNLLNAPGS